MKRIVIGAAVLLLIGCLAACGAEATAPRPEQTAPVPKSPDSSAIQEPAAEAPAEEEENMLQMLIGETAVTVEWENNASVRALGDLCREEPLVLSLSMYGGFEQVGPIGTRLPRDDVQTTTVAGDIVLYSGDQIVVFYGSNSWAYTRLGHISDQSAADMEALLGHGDVTLTLQMEADR